jgi:hypothetical protein
VLSIWFSQPSDNEDNSFFNVFSYRTQVILASIRERMPKKIKLPVNLFFSDGTTTGIAEPMHYVLLVKMNGSKVDIEMKDGKIWNKACIAK